VNTGRAQVSTTAACWTLFVLFLTNVFNVVDRTLLGVVTEPVRIELSLSDTEISLASGFLFVLFNLAGGLFIARFIDLGNRKRILAMGLAGWSLATAATGLAHDFVTLSIARIGVGVGEATAFPAAMSLIPDLFRQEARGKAVAVFQSSAMVGVVGGAIVAGVLAAALGWRSMFIVCGAAGVALAAVLLLTVREPLREAEASPAPRSRSYLADLHAACGRVFGRPGFVPLALAFGIAGVIGAVLGAWAPAYLQRSYGVPLAEVGLMIGPAVGLGGVAGTLVSGVLADWLVRRRGRPVDMLRVPLISLPLAVPFTAGFALAPTAALAMVFAAAMNFCLTCTVPPCINFAVNQSDPRDRGVTATIMLAATGLIGGGLGPFMVGALSDALGARYGAESLRYAIAATVFTPLLSTVFLIAAIRRAPAIPAPAAAA
jgi:MFS family permease